MGSGVEQSSRSIWPSIYPKVLRLVRRHRARQLSSINNRRLAGAARVAPERARGGRSPLGPFPRLARASSDSSSRAPGQIRASWRRPRSARDRRAPSTPSSRSRPKSVARGLQRVGRAEARPPSPVSRGRIFPKFRADLLESAGIVARAMRESAIEELASRNPLDVLAQQIVAVCADEEVSVDDLHARPSRVSVLRPLSRPARERPRHVGGPLPVRRVRRLRPRVVWDRTAGSCAGAPARGDRHQRRHDPGRGLFGVHLVDGGGQVGELDEEMVYEAREGQTFLLGASTWRIGDITRDRVLVSPAPGVPGVAPFWKRRGSVGRLSSGRRSAVPP